jgi:hypothetical protein
MAYGSPDPNARYQRGGSEHAGDAAGEPSIAQLLSGLLADGQTLIQKELTLARQEVADTLSTARQSAIALGVGASIAAAGSLLLLFALVYGVADGFNLPLWLSYLIVGAILLVVGALALISGVNRLKQVRPVPSEAIDSVRKDLQWLKEQTPIDRP